MQDAFVVDQQRKGSFTEIGYEIPTSSVFSYTDAADTSFEASAGGKLDKCGNGDTWTIGVTVSGAQAEYTPSDNCPELTPNFKNIGSSS